MSLGAMNILAIDQSTSSTKGLVYNLQGGLIDRFAIDHAPIYPKRGWVEHDADELWRNTVSIIRRAGDKHRTFAFLCITNQRETFVIFDRATGKPLYNAVVWQCRRGDDICAELQRGGHDELVTRKTGLKLDSYFSAPKLAELLRENPDLQTKLRSGGALFGTIDTYLLYRLTNGETFATDSTNACRTLLYNINTLTWDTELCELFQVPMNALPVIRDCASEFGICDRSIVPSSLPVAGIMGDSQAALFAHRCFEPGQAKVTLGTGSSILLNTGPHPSPSGIRTIAWTINGKPAYCSEGIISDAGAVITWLRDQLGLIRSPDETEAAARSVPDNGGVCFVPAFSGFSGRNGSGAGRAAIVGLSASSNRNHVIRAALESIVYQIKSALDSMFAPSELALTSIHADGGASRNLFLVQLIADIVGVPVTLSGISDCSSLGAAYAGMLGTRIHSSLDELKTLPRAVRLISPQMPKPPADALYAAWIKAVHQVLG